MNIFLAKAVPSSVKRLIGSGDPDSANASKSCLSPRKRQLTHLFGYQYYYFRLFWLHNGYFGGNLLRKIRPACNVMTHAVLPIRRSDAADISNVYLPVREDLFRFISFPPLRFSEDVKPLSADEYGIFKGNFPQIFTDTGVISVDFPAKKPIYTDEMLFVYYFLP